MNGFRFEKLDVWHKALELADRIYVITRSFPNDERFGLTSQLRRAAVSISSNIAEGSSRRSDTDFVRFVEIAYGSLLEVVSELHVARRQELVAGSDFESLIEDAERLARMLSGLTSSLRQPRSSSQIRRAAE